MSAQTDRVIPPPHLVALALALLLGLQPLATDLYLPAMPLIAQDLGAPMSAMQATMWALILAFGLGQLVWGPVADRFGRRPVLLISLSLFWLASLGAWAAQDFAVLITWRAAQGACMAAAVVCARAMVRDLYEPHQGAHVMSLGLSGLGVIAFSGPMIGGLLSSYWGWRATMAAVALGVGVTLLFVWRALPETLPQRDPHATRIGPLARTAARVLRHPTFLAWAALIACTYGGLFTLLAASAFVYVNVLGVSPAAYGFALGSGSVFYLIGTFWCRRWLLHHGLVGAVQRGAAFSLAGGLSMAALALAGVEAVWAVLLPHWLYAFGHGIHQPCGQAGAVGPFPRSAGVASALAGFLLCVVAAAVGLWLGQALDGTVLPMALGLCFWAVMTAGVAWTLVRRHGEATQA